MAQHTLPSAKETSPCYFTPAPDAKNSFRVSDGEGAMKLAPHGPNPRRAGVLRTSSAMSNYTALIIHCTQWLTSLLIRFQLKLIQDPCFCYRFLPLHEPLTPLTYYHYASYENIRGDSICFVSLNLVWIWKKREKERKRKNTLIATLP